MMMPRQGIQLRDFFKIISRRRWVVAIFCATAVTVVVFVNLMATPLYEGVTKVLMERGESGELSGRARTVYDAEFYQTQFELIKSQAVARRVIDILAIDETNAASVAPSSPLAHLSGTLSTLVRWAKGDFGTTPEKEGEKAQNAWRDRTAAAISAAIRVTPMAESHLVTIRYASPDPVYAAQVANTAAQAFVEETLKMKVEASRRSLGWMSEKAQGERKALEQAEQELQHYMQNNGIVTVDDRITIAPEQLSELSTQLVRAEVRRKELEALYAKVASFEERPRAAETVTVVAADPTLQLLRAQIVETEKRVMELGNKYGPKHPVMLKAASDLEQLQARLQQEVRRIVQTVHNDYELALANERSLRAQLDATKSETLQLNERFIRYGALKREVDAIRQTYDALTLKLRAQGITGETQPVNLWMVEEAVVPTVPATPRKGLNLALGLLLGLCGGIGLALLLEYLDNRITDPEAAELALASPVLSVIPLCREQGRLIEGIVLKEPLSAFSENYKTLRSVLLLAASESPPCRIFITSATMGEGKTTTAVNLAIALAQTDHRVVLVDGDLRKSSVHKHFKVENRVGLSTYLAGGGTDGLLQQGPLSNLSLITAGPTPANPSELVASQRLQVLLNHLGEHFDFIICDSPPVLQVGDALMLGRFFSQAIVVTKAHQTTTETALRAIKVLRQRKLQVLGVVINGMSPRHDEYYYGEYHAGARQRSLVPSRAMLAEAFRHH